MNKVDYECAKLWADNPKFKKKVDNSTDIIKEILSKCSNPFIAFSCGKDSSVLAHMVINQDKTIPLRFLSSGETRIVHDVDKIINYFKQIGANVQEINVDRVFSEEWKEASWKEQRKAGNKDMELLNLGQWDCVFMGLRAEESRPRKISLNRHQTKNLPSFCYQYDKNNKKRADMIRCCPLAYWTVLDISAYLSKYNIPVLQWYENFGINSRTTARLTGDSVRQNVLLWLKTYNPDGYNKLMKRFPEFRLFV